MLLALQKMLLFSPLSTEKSTPELGLHLALFVAGKPWAYSWLGQVRCPKVFKVMRGMHFCQRRYEIIPCRVKPITIRQQVALFLRRLFWILNVGDLWFSLEASSKATSTSEQREQYVRGPSVAFRLGHGLVDCGGQEFWVPNLSVPTSIVANRAEHEFISWLAPIHRVAFVCHWLYPQTSIIYHYNPRPCC